MSGTTRRHSPAVYRRRRLVLLLALLVVAAVVWLLIAQPWSGSASEGAPAPQSQEHDAATELPAVDSDSDAAATPSATDDAESPSPSPSATLAAEPCVSRDIAVEALSDMDTYGSDQNPQLSIRLTNNGEDCTLNVGTATQSFTVTSGSDTWWRSTDCQTEPSDMVVILAEGQTVESATPIEWDRTRSAVGTCGDDDRARAPGGGSSYHLSVEIGGIASTQAKQFLLY